MLSRENYFVVINWDQRGAGKSYAAINPVSAMTVEQYISDTYDLVQMLRKRFNQEKIYLVGHSWGTILGVLTAQRYPDLFHAYIGIGQMVDVRETDRINYEYGWSMAKKLNNADTFELLYPQLYQMNLNLVEQAPKLDVPIYFVEGRYEYDAPFELAEEYYNLLEAPKKEFIWFEKSGHYPCYEESGKFNSIMVNKVLASTYQK